MRSVNRNLQDEDAQFNRSIEQTIRNVVKKFEVIGGRVNLVHHRGVLSAENIGAVTDSVENMNLTLKKTIDKEEFTQSECYE